MSITGRNIHTGSFKTIYIYSIDDGKHEGILKVGETTFETSKNVPRIIETSQVNKRDGAVLISSPDIDAAARRRINQQTGTARIEYKLEKSFLAVIDKGNGTYESYRDHDIHKILVRHGIKKDGEWFKTDLKTIEDAIVSLQTGVPLTHFQNNLTGTTAVITLRNEQRLAVNKAKSVLTGGTFKKPKKMLWSAIMRFGKTLSAYSLVKEVAEFKKVLIITHRPVVSKGWYKDFIKIFGGDKRWNFASKEFGMTWEQVKSLDQFFYFASIQDLRGSFPDAIDPITGEIDFDKVKELSKNGGIFDNEWDLIITDEAHEGTKTALSGRMYGYLKTRNTLVLSGTPFNIVEDFDSNEIFTWDYIDEQKARKQFAIDNPDLSNPYDSLPQLEIRVIDISENFGKYKNHASGMFNFNAFFKTQPKQIQGGNTSYVDGDTGLVIDVEDGVIDGLGTIDDVESSSSDSGQKVEFIAPENVDNLLALITKSDDYQKDKRQFPFGTKHERDMFKHSFWLLPSVDAAAALEEMLNVHPVFENYEIINVAGSHYGSSEALQAVNDAISIVDSGINKNHPHKVKGTITLSISRLTTGVTVTPWTAVLMLSNMSSPISYLQAAFRVKSGGSLSDGRMKETGYIYDFLPNRALQMIVKAAEHGTNSREERRAKIEEFLEYLPIISDERSRMRRLDTDSLMEMINAVYINNVVNSGFNTPQIMNNNLTGELTEEQADILNRIGLGFSQAKNDRNKVIPVNPFNDKLGSAPEQKETDIPKQKEEVSLTPEEMIAEEMRKQSQKEAAENRKNQALIACAVAARSAFMVFGSDRTKVTTLKNLTTIIDDESWEEFMPLNFTKEDFTFLQVFFDEDIFNGAIKEIIRRIEEVNKLDIIQRVGGTARLFSIFKNPDKETILTPFNVVNIQYGGTFGGLKWTDNEGNWRATDGKYHGLAEFEAGNMKHDPIWVETKYDKDGFWTNDNTTIMDINSKSALYPLYAAASMWYAKKQKQDADGPLLGRSEVLSDDELWQTIIEKNIFVNCRVPYAERIAQRVLCGYSDTVAQTSTANILKLDRILKDFKIDDELRNKIWLSLLNPEDIKKSDTETQDLFSVLDKMEVIFDDSKATKDDRKKYMQKRKEEILGWVEKIRTKELKLTKNGETLPKYTAIVGNPPYQISNTTVNTDVWQDFIKVSGMIAETGSFIHPGRWVVPKKRMVSVQEQLVQNGLVMFDYITYSPFPDVTIGGNISITLFNFETTPDNIHYSVNGGERLVWNRDKIFFSNHYEEEIYKKFEHLLEKGTMNDILIGRLGSLGGEDFGYAKTNMIDFLSLDNTGMSKPIKIWANRGFGKGTRLEWLFIDESKLNLSKMYKDATRSRKVMIDKVGNAPGYMKSTGNVFNGSAEIVGKDTIGSGKLVFIPVNDTDEDLLLISSLLTTRTARCLMTVTQKDLYVRGLDNIPLYTLLKEKLMLSEKKAFDDKWFYDEFKFSDELIEYIEKHISKKSFDIPTLP